MRKLYEKSSLGFALMWIGIYCVTMSLGDSLSQSVGIEKAVTLPVAITLSAVLLVFIKKNGLSEKYGLCKPCVPASKMLFFLPLMLLLFANLIYGFDVSLSLTEAVLYVLTMLCVGFIEELIFRGLLFNAMKKQSFKSAVIVSSLTFGMGHIINLINGSGAELFENILQIVYATAAGFMLVAIYIRSKSLVPCVVFHGIFNALSLFTYNAEISTQKQIFSCIFLVAVSIAYAAYLVLTDKKAFAE